MITITFSTYITVNTDGSDHLWRVNQVTFRLAIISSNVLYTHI